MKRRALRHTILAVAIVALAASIGVSAGDQASQTRAAASSSAVPASADSPAAFQAMVTRYCVTCHNQRAKIPAGAPHALDMVNLADPGADAEIWEKVVRKIGVGAMPPQGSPTPGHAELKRFATVLASTLDRAAAQKNNPGRYVLHRLNRTEYANSIRDLLGVEIGLTRLGEQL